MNDRVALITGGGTGIGREAAIQLAQVGFYVAVVGRRLAPLEETASQSDRIIPIAADILEQSERDLVLQIVTSRWDRVDVLVNNAGTFIQRPLEAVDSQMLSSLFATNVQAPSLLTQALLPILKRSQGSIINVSSTFGHKAAPAISHYAASKAALEHLTRCWALELAPFGVRVNAIAPGPTDTEILAGSGLTAAEIQQIKQQEAERIPLGRRGTAKEVAAWIATLANPSATWITGQVIAVDGGLSAA